MRKTYAVGLVSGIVLALTAVLFFTLGQGAALAQKGVVANGEGAEPAGAAPDLGPHPDWPDESAPNAALSHYRLLGPVFDPRASASTYAYLGNGCVYQTGGTDPRFVAPLLLPDGAEIKYLRLYFDDTSVASNVEAWITRYQPGTATVPEDVAYVVSTGSAGPGTALSAIVTHTVDITNWAYVVIVGPGAATSAVSWCGVRVAYYAPITSGLLPAVLRNSAP